MTDNIHKKTIIVILKGFWPVLVGMVIGVGSVLIFNMFGLYTSIAFLFLTIGMMIYILIYRHIKKYGKW